MKTGFELKNICISMPIKKTDIKATTTTAAKAMPPKAVATESAKTTKAVPTKTVAVKAEPAKSDSKAKKVYPKVGEILVEDANSSSDDDEEEEEDESESGSDSGSDDDKQVAAPEVDAHEVDGDSKDKKTKKTYQELCSEYEKFATDIKENETKHKALLEEIRLNEKHGNELERQRNKIYQQMGKSHEEEVKKARKEKPKRKGNKDGGFNKELPVPPVLIKFLGLEDGTKLSRPKVMSNLNEKFKSLGLKNGQSTTLDKDTAKALGKEKGRVVEFTAFQSFLKEFYEEAFPTEGAAKVAL